MGRANAPSIRHYRWTVYSVPAQPVVCKAQVDYGSGGVFEGKAIHEVAVDQSLPSERRKLGKGIALYRWGGPKDERCHPDPAGITSHCQLNDMGDYTPRVRVEANGT